MKLKDLGTIFTGNTPKKSDKLNYNSNDICFVKPSDISEKEITHINHTEYYIANHAYNSARLAPKNSILVTCIGIIGKIAILEKECAFNQQINAIIPNEKKIISYYLAYALKYKKKSMQDKANAPVVPIINKTEFSEINIKVPSLEKQKKIVNILIKIDKIINWRFQQLNKLNQLVSSLFIEMFGDPWINNKNYTIDKLKNYCILNPLKEKNIKKDELCSFIGMASITENGDINTNNIKKFLEVSKGFTYFLENDVLFAKITPCMENGKGAIAQNLCNGIGAGSTEFHVLRPLTNKSNPYWLYILTTLKHFRILAEKNMTGSAGQRRVPISFLENFQLPIPPIELQENFAKKVQQIDKSKYASGYVKLIFIQNKILNIFFS